MIDLVDPVGVAVIVTVNGVVGLASYDPEATPVEEFIVTQEGSHVAEYTIVLQRVSMTHPALKKICERPPLSPTVIFPRLAKGEPAGATGIGSFVATTTVAFRDVDGIHELFGLVSVEVRVRL